MGLYGGMTKAGQQLVCSDSTVVNTSGMA
jgi:hypothetical protein